MCIKLCYPIGLTEIEYERIPSDFQFIVFLFYSSFIEYVNKMKAAIGDLFFSKFVQ